MALSLTQAMDRCMDLGEKFAEHFNKIVDEGISSNNFTHHCIEMQSWWDKVKNLRLKHNNKVISNVNLIDWFFTGGKDVEDLINEDKVNLYNEFLVKLLIDRNRSIEDLFIEMFNN